MDRPAHDEGLVCICVSDHHPDPLELEIHHVWPTYLGGPDEEWNRLPLCPTTHMNSHELMRPMLKLNRALAFVYFTERYAQPVNKYAWRVARAGYLRFKYHHEGLDPQSVVV